MFQRFHEPKPNQETEMIPSGTGGSGSSRSSTPGTPGILAPPGTPLDNRIMYSHPNSIGTSISTSSYQVISSLPSLVSQGSQVMSVQHNVFTGKYVSPGTPPEAHRYTPEGYRVTVDGYDSQRLTVDPYRQSPLSVDSQRIDYRQSPVSIEGQRIDLSRIRVEEHPVEAYQRVTVSDPYRTVPIDLQRIPDQPLPSITSHGHRMTPDLQRMQMNDHRILIETPASPISEDLSRIPDSAVSIGNPNGNVATIYRSVDSPDRVVVHDGQRILPPDNHLRLTPDASLRVHAEPPRLEEDAVRSHLQDSNLRTLDIQRMLQDSSLRLHSESRLIEDASLGRPHGDTRILEDTGVRTHVDASMVGQRTNADAQRMVQESLGLRDYFPTQRDIAESLRSPEQRTLPENLSYSAPEPVRYVNQDITTQRTLVQESLRLGTETPHHIMPENLRIVSEPNSLVPENLSISEQPHQIMPENLRIAPSDLNSATPISNGNGHMIEIAPPESPMPAMRHYTHPTPHRMMPESPHHMREPMRVESPVYSESIYRNDLHNHIVPPAPPTPAPSVPPIPDPCSTPAPQYYSSPFTGHTPHTPQYSHYISADALDDRNTHEAMAIDDRIDSCYQDIKPFDQEYPLPLHISQEPLPPPSVIPKPPKPKKPKEPKPPRIPVVHKCSDCDRVFKNSTQLKNHMWRHTGEKPFACEECGSRFTQQGNLRAHRRIHTGERPYQCTECNSCFTQLSTLKTHQKIHSDERPYQCDQCDAAFRQIANLKTHHVTHTGERPHKCDQCDKAFTQKSNLKAHKNRVHSGESANGGIPAKRGRKRNPTAIKPFTCLECGAKFTMISNLKIHMKLHSGDRPFECDYCGAGFAQNSNLKTHIQRMHGRIPGQVGPGRRRIRCDECPAMFRLKRCLKTHKRKRHPIKSLKIKILRESKYLSAEDLPEDEYEDDDDDDEDAEDAEDEDDDCEDDYDDDSIQDQERGPSEETGETSNFIQEPIVQIREPKQEPIEAPPTPPMGDFRPSDTDGRNDDPMGQSDPAGTYPAQDRNRTEQVSNNNYKMVKLEVMKEEAEPDETSIPDIQDPNQQLPTQPPIHMESSS